MDVILLQNVDNLGTMGKVVQVAPGYARNFLLPRGMAVVATPGARKMVAERMVLAAKHDHRRKEAAEVLAGQLVARNIAVTIAAKAGEGNRLYGSVSARDIAGALADQASLEIDHHQIQLDEPIKELGDYEVAVKLHAEVQISVKVSVLQED
jgi:large subunit ribosomal protein L9